MSLEESLDGALKANRSLQSSIRLELERLAQRKADNRRTAARLIQLLKDTHTVVSREQCLPSNAITNKQLTRKWNRFFFDDGSTRPEPNADTLRRQKLESSTFFFHRQPPWSKKETTKLQSIVQELQSEQASKEDTTNETVDFEQVARRFNAKGSNSKETVVSRSPTECKIHYQSLQKPAPFSKQESLHILEQVHMYQEQKQTPDWQAIASSLSSTCDPTNHRRTAWDCLVAYQNTALRPVQPQTWTVAQDEFLLKYMAAAGPQFVVDGESIQHLLTLFQGSKSKSQLLGRINQSLVNPNLKRDFWDSDEERKLAILMKVYSDYDSSSSSSPQVQAPLYMASTHMPRRSTKSVADKWNRSLNPEYSSRPFSESEDQKLLRIVRNEPQLGWTEISQQHFPERHPQRLSNRWSELAKDEDILRKSRNLLVRERRVVTTKDEPQTSSAAALTANDFVVQVKKKRRR